MEQSFTTGLARTEDHTQASGSGDLRTTPRPKCASGGSAKTGSATTSQRTVGGGHVQLTTGFTNNGTRVAENIILNVNYVNRHYC